MKSVFSGSGFLAVSLLFPSPLKAASFTEVYEFGDSLLDTGNLFEFTSAPPPPGAPAPATPVLFPGPPYPGAPYMNYPLLCSCG